MSESLFLVMDDTEHNINEESLPKLSEEDQKIMDDIFKKIMKEHGL